MAENNLNTYLRPEPTAGYSKLLLLVEKNRPDSAAIEVNGRKWHVMDYSGEETPLAYTCISYIWGDDNERVLNPYKHTGAEIISTHTLPALTTAVANFYHAGHAFWLDAFCIPAAGPGASEESRKCKQATLESMGHIYSCAEQVCVVLPEQSYLAMDYMNKYMENNDKACNNDAELEEPAARFDILENDRWIQSVWTYQEVMESNNVFFLSENADKPKMPIWKIANALGYCQSALQKQVQGMSRYAEEKKYPRLDEFITLAGDWRADSESYALKAMANMDWRQAKEEKTYWYARMGAISKQRQQRPTDGTGRELAMRFMDICDEKGDFSYIFSSAPREGDIEAEAFPSVRRARRWRPIPDRDPMTGFLKLSAIVPAHNHGRRQPGKLDLFGRVLMLEGIAIYAVEVGTKMSPSTVKWFSTWDERQGHLQGAIDTCRGEVDLERIRTLVLSFLRIMGFTGAEHCIVLEDGLFFPQRQFPRSAKAHVLVSTAISYPFGSPGLLKLVEPGERLRYIPGILVGEVNKDCTRHSTMLLN